MQRVTSASPPLQVTLPAEGILGATGTAAFEVRDDHVEIRSSDVAVTVKLNAINGILVRPGSFDLLTRHGVWRFQSSGDIARMERDLVTRAGALAGVTRALRALGSHRGRPGAEHDVFFAPLLAARRRAQRAADGAVRLASFEGATIRRALESSLLELARKRYPDHASARRATEEEFLEIAEPLLEACELLAARAAAVRNAEADVVIRRWREWTEAVQRVFEVADRTWLRLAHALEQPLRQRAPAWKRLFSR